jgi:hypothetical protein
MGKKHRLNLIILINIVKIADPPQRTFLVRSMRLNCKRRFRPLASGERRKHAQEFTQRPRLERAAARRVRWIAVRDFGDVAQARFVEMP